MSANRPSPVRRCRRRLLSRSFRLSLVVACAIAPAAFAPPSFAAEPSPAGQQLPKSDLSIPLGKQLQGKFDAIDREVARLRKVGGKAVAQADQLARETQTIRDRLDGKLTPGQSAEPELHLVGVYEGDFPNRPKKFGRAVVQLDVTDRPVVLALTAYSPVRWDVRLGQGVKLQKVVVSGYGEQILDPAPPAGVPVEIRTFKGGQGGAFFGYDPAYEKYPAGVRALKDWTQLDVATFQGKYRFTGEPIVVGPTSNDWRIRRALADLEPFYLEATAYERSLARQAVPPLRFTAIHWTNANPPFAAGAWGEFTATGPIESTLRPLPQGMSRVAVDPRGPTYYGLAGQLVRFDPRQPNAVTPLEIQGDLPELSWPCAVAFDTKRNRVILTSLGGVGYMYAYEPDKDQWSLVRDMRDTDLSSLTYAADEDCFYGLAVDHGEREKLIIHRFKADGAFDRKIEPNPRLPGDSRSFHSSPPQVVAAGGKLVVLAPPSAEPGAAATPGTMTSTIIDSATGKVLQSRPVRPSAEPRAIAAEEIERQWLALVAAANPTDADAAVQQLAGAGDPAVAVIRAKLPPSAARPDAARVRAWIAQLDAPDWKARDAATAELAAIALQIRPELEAALSTAGTDERRTRLQGILKTLAAQLATPPTPDEPAAAVRDPALRARLRAIRVLGRLVTPDAVDLLRELATDSPDALIISQAKATLRGM